MLPQPCTHSALHHPHSHHLHFFIVINSSGEEVWLSFLHVPDHPTILFGSFTTSATGSQGSIDMHV
jgi:hypothetical protein